LRVAVAAYLARYKGLSRYHTESDLRVFLRWCADRGLDPLTVRRVDVELFVRWLQEVRRFKPSTVSRRLSVVICFYRTCVIERHPRQLTSRVRAQTAGAGRVAHPGPIAPAARGHARRGKNLDQPKLRGVRWPGRLGCRA
jgi:integrase/recombinase XerD